MMLLLNTYYVAYSYTYHRGLHLIYTCTLIVYTRESARVFYTSTHSLYSHALFIINRANITIP